MSGDPRRSRAADLVEPILGFRQWRLRDSGLWSPFSEVLWASVELRARCARGRHEHADTPAKSCACGIYAHYDPCARTAAAGTREFVSGVVAVWGRVELHATGLRASHARIVALERPPFPGARRGRLAGVAERLGVPAVRRRDLAVVASEHGAPLAAALRPPSEWTHMDACLAVVERLRSVS